LSNQFLPSITESKNGLAFCDITTFLVMFQMTFVEPPKRLRGTLGVRSYPG